MSVEEPTKPLELPNDGIQLKPPEDADPVVEMVPTSVMIERLAVKTAKNQEQERTIADLTTRLEKGETVTIEQLQGEMAEDRAKQEAFIQEVGQERILVKVGITDEEDINMVRWRYNQATANEPMPFDVWVANHGKDDRFVGPLLVAKPEAPPRGTERGPLVHTDSRGVGVLEGLASRSVTQRTSKEGRQAFWDQYNKESGSA